MNRHLDELLALCHRIVVLLRGRVVGERSTGAGGVGQIGPGGSSFGGWDEQARAALGAMMTGAEVAA